MHVVLFLFALGALVVLLQSALPPIDEQDRDKIKIPKKFEDLKDLNGVLQVYKERNYTRVMLSFVVVYLL